MRYKGKTDKEWRALQDKYMPTDPETYRSPRDKIYVGRKVDDHAFKSWERDNEVCARCGSLRSVHTDQTKLEAAPKTTEFGKQYWAWLMRHGGAYSVYGIDTSATIAVLDHLESCSLRDDLAEPSMGEMDEFDGTDAGNSQVPAVIGKLQCACGEVTELCDWGNDVRHSYNGGFDTVRWAVKHDGLTLGQVIFQVINEL